MLARPLQLSRIPAGAAVEKAFATAEATSDADSGAFWMRSNPRDVVGC
jgi:hypothetical protein